MFLLICLGIYFATTFAAADITGSVVVSDGNTLKIHSEPSTSAPTLYNVANGAAITIACYVKGTTVSGIKGTTDQWDEIKSNQYGIGYASHAYINSSEGTDIPPCFTAGTVVVSWGNTLKVHVEPSDSSATLYNLQNGASVNITCVTTGTTVSGVQVTTNRWYEINSDGFASAAYMTSSGNPGDCSGSIASSTFQMALKYGMENIGTLYVGCAGGNYRFGVPAPNDMYHNGTVCGQSRVYFQPKGSVGFDCSGLMVEMFNAAGIHLPYSSSTDIKDHVPEVSKSSLRNGDMLAKNGHVVMWIGNNQVIESTPYAQNADSSWTGTRVNSANSYLSSADYTAHRYPGLN